MTVRDGKLAPGGITEQCECVGEGEAKDVKGNWDDEGDEDEKGLPDSSKESVSDITKNLQDALRGVIESDANEKAKIECLAEAVRRALELVDSALLESSPVLFKILLDTEKAGEREEKRSLSDYVPNLGNDKLNDEYVSFVRSFQNVGLRRFLMACGKFKLGEKLTYEMIDAAQREISGGHTLACVANFRYGDFLRTTLPFYFDIKTRGGRSEKGRKVTVMRLLRRRTK